MLKEISLVKELERVECIQFPPSGCEGDLVYEYGAILVGVGISEVARQRILGGREWTWRAVKLLM